MSPRRIWAVALAAGALGLAATPAAAIQASRPSGGRPQLDVRSGQRTPVPAGVLGARHALAQRLGIEGHVSTDPGGGIRVLDRTDGFLSGPHAGDAAAVALAWVRANAVVFGLAGAEIDALRLADRTTSNDGVTHLTWAPVSHGVPAYDSALRVHVTRDGRVIAASGPPLGGLSIPSAAPQLTASQALGAAQADVGATTSIPRAATRAGVQRPTTFANGDSARLVVFQSPTGDRLAWRLTVAGQGPYLYDEVVDAATGQVLARHSLTDFASSAHVFFYHPGAAVGGTATQVDLSPWLTSTTRLSGSYAHAYADPKDDGQGTDGRPVDIPPSSGTDWEYPQTLFSPGSGQVCSPFGVRAICTWDGTTIGSELTNRAQVTTQVFYFVNTYHDWLKQDPIDFDDASGNFEVGGTGGSDPVDAETDDSILGANPQVDNANMSTPPDGQSPRMQMYLFDSPYPAVNGGDDASIVYHEYTHGLSNRLIDNASGLNDNQPGAMGEGWSDWYAMDYLVATGFVDDTAADGEVVVGEYATGDASHGIRNQPLDCAVGSSAPNCGGSPTAGSGGFTYADLGRVGSYDGVTPRFEVHDDGEIWSETLWDLRKALGPYTARKLITNAMRLSPADPSFLDERDAILLADENADGGANHAAIWQVFAARGMGYGADTTSPNATRALASFATPSLAENGGVTVADPAPGGDGDGIPEPGETVHLRVTLDNPGLVGLTNVHGTLSATTSGVSVSAPGADYGAIAAGRSAPDTTPYSVAIGRGVGCGTLVDFTLHVTSDQGSVDVPVAVALGSGDTTFTATDGARAIPDDDPTSQSAVSQIAVPTGGRIDHLQVVLNLTHTFAGDLVARLTSPAGTTIDLFERPGIPYGNSGMAWSAQDPVTFDDAATASIQDLGNGSGTVSGSFVPDEPLAAFAGEDRAGTWSLRLTDEAAGDTGTLNGWSLVADRPGCASAAVPPIATTGTATGVTDGGATLGGSIDAGSAPTTYRFDYGATAAYGQTTPEASAGSAMGAVAESASVANLTSSTLYHFRIVALRGGVPVAFGADQTFTTAAAPVLGGGGGSGDAGAEGGSGPTGGSSGGAEPVSPIVSSRPVIAPPTALLARATLSAHDTLVYAFRAAPGLRASIRFTIPKHGRTKAITFGARSFVVSRSGRVRLTVRVGGSALAQLRKLHSTTVTVTLVLGGRRFRFSLKLSAARPRRQR